MIKFFKDLTTKFYQRYDLVFLILVICGISNPLILTLKLDLDNPFDLISPKPGVFSEQQEETLTKKLNRYFYEISYLDKQKSATQIKFDQAFYRKIPGPHKHKIVYITFFRKLKFINTGDFHEFIEDQICQKERLFTIFNLKGDVDVIKLKNLAGDELINIRCEYGNM